MKTIKRKTKLPLLTPTPINPRSKATFPLALKRLLVPLDFSGKSRQALKYAVPLAESFGGKIVLIHVVQPRPVPAPELIMLAGDPKPSLRESEQHLKELARTLIPLRLFDRAIVRFGHPADVITATAKSLQADLIVLSTLGKTGLKRFFMGSTAELIVRHADCPVLSVRRI